MILLSNSIAIKKTKKKQKNPLQKKTRQERNRFYILCHLYLATLSLKKNHSTVSPILGPVHLVLPRKKTLFNCVTYTWPHLLLKKICLLCHLYMATFICFSTCCHTLDTIPYCVSYRWSSSPNSATEEDDS